MNALSERTFAIAVMAAGKGTRLKSKRPKVLHEIGGKPLLRHVLDAALNLLPADDIFVIVGHQAAEVEAAVRETGVSFVLQREQRGTGHAIQCLAEFFEDEGLVGADGYANLLVLSGDVPLIRSETIARIRDFHLQQKAAMTILTARPDDPTGYGRVIRAAGNVDSAAVSAIVEQKALTAEQKSAPEINSGIYAFQTTPLLENISRLGTDNSHAEYYLTDMAALLVAAGARVVALEAQRVAEILGANTIAEMMDLDRTMRMDKANQLMATGVTIFSPESCVIDDQVEVGADTVIEPNVQLRGKTKIGANCTIRSFSMIENSVLADGVLVRQSCVIEGATVGAKAVIGPFAHLRPESVIGEEAHVGNFVETKKVKLGKRSKANHLAYLGDAEIGESVNIGAGTITCNFDGDQKHATHIGDGSFIGSNGTLVAPLTIGEGAYVAAGSTITEDVPSGALALGRARQTTKEGWVGAKKKAKKKRE